MPMAPEAGFQSDCGLVAINPVRYRIGKTSVPIGTV
ncbi:hypothetical protein FHS81_000564 [Pseudochelatococcus contaminans]|uniref:Uncharacterized protein n=1 Tax=Pseudochelatococcus contaminans TaxID=1538103 RepID=A0A7W5Z1T7_9HYPH|nr:hypothetical protein [Pseudochelatococcus contaminans]